MRNFIDLMASRRLNYTQLAALTGLNHSYISRIVAGYRVPSLRTAVALASALKVDLVWMATLLLDGGENG